MPVKGHVATQMNTHNRVNAPKTSGEALMAKFLVVDICTTFAIIVILRILTILSFL